MISILLDKLLGTVIGKVLGAIPMKMYIYAAVGAALLSLGTFAYFHYQGLLDTIEDLHDEVTTLNVVIAGKDAEIQDKKNDIAILTVEKDSYKDSVESGVAEAIRLQGKIQETKKEHRDAIAIWKKKTDRLSAPFQRRPHTVIKRINAATDKLFHRINKDTNSKSN